MKKERADGKKVSETLGKIAGETSTKAKSVFVKSKESVINAIDANGNGEIDIEDIIIIGLRTPGDVYKRQASRRWRPRRPGPRR